MQISLLIQLSCPTNSPAIRKSTRAALNYVYFINRDLRYSFRDFREYREFREIHLQTHGRTGLTDHMACRNHSLLRKSIFCSTTDEYLKSASLLFRRIALWSSPNASAKPIGFAYFRRFPAKFAEFVGNSRKSRN